MEIDDYRDYEKAHAALKEAVRQLGKASDPGGGYISRMSQEMAHRISLIEKFVHARKALHTNPASMVTICEQLLAEPNIDDAIRVGDCLAMLVEHLHSKRDLEGAYRYMQEMESRKIAIHPYLDSAVVEEISKAMGVSSNYSSPVKTKAGNEHEIDDVDIDEDIAEELNDSDEDKSIEQSPKWGRPYAAPRK